MAQKRAVIDRYAGPSVVGVDVSAYQDAIQWEKLVRGGAWFEGKLVGPVEFAIVRSSDGVQTRHESKPDPYAVRNLRGAHGAGLPVALYHFARARHSAAAQVEVILDVARTAGVPLGFIALDIEGRPDDPTTPDTDESGGAWWHPDGEKAPSTKRVVECVLEMARLLQVAGYRVLVYGGQALHWHLTMQGFRLDDLELWATYYTTGAAPKLPVDRNGDPVGAWAEWRIWQFAGSKKLPGRVEGIRGAVDLNRFRGSSEDLAEWWNVSDVGDGWSLDRIRELAGEARTAGAIDAANGLDALFSLLVEPKGCES